METQEAANQLLKNRYDLHNTPEVRTASDFTRKRTGEKVPQDPNSQIQNYLDRMQEIFSPDFEDPHGRQILEERILNRYTTRFEDIPESYWKSQERILRERGQQGDYNRFSDEQKDEWKKQISEGLLNDQRASLEQWINYFSSPDSSYIPPQIKYWFFRSVVKLSEYDKEEGKFPERSRGTLKMFPDINPEALAFVNDAVIKKLEGKGLDFGNFEFDLTQEQKEIFQGALQRENFANLYAWANEQIAPIPQHLLPISAGEWVKYERGSDFKPLVDSVRGKGTGWCIAADSTAKSYLIGGDMYVYYSHDENGNPTIPRLAIRKEESRIAEVRGIDFKQNVDPYMPEVLSEKLEEFPDKKNYLKRASDMEHLTEIDARVQAGLQLSRNDLIFLYELNTKIEGFGYEKDPRVEEIRSQRNPEEDMLIIFDCDKEQIARHPSEINESTKAYVGSIAKEDSEGNLLPEYKNIFHKLADIENIYTSFPEGKIKFDTVTIGGKSKEQLEQELVENDINVTQYAQDMMKNPDFTTLSEPEELPLVRLSVGDLGISKYRPTTDDIYKRARELGLELPPAEVGPHYRIKYTDQPAGERFSIGMKQITDSSDLPDVFRLGHDDDGLWLGGRWARPGDGWDPGDGLVFALRKS